jgi:predicted ribonuclease toxin of YeeF-YezG toxin-antitoxin module
MEHYNRALEQGVPKDKLKPVADLVNNAAKAIEQLKQLDQQAADLQQQSSQHDAEEAIIEQEDQQLQPPTV